MGTKVDSRLSEIDSFFPSMDLELKKVDKKKWHAQELDTRRLVLSTSRQE